MKITKAIFLYLLSIVWLHAGAQEEKKYIAYQARGYDVFVDGQLNEPAWQTVKWENQFIQYELHEGKSPHQQTEFAILYDEYNLYVAIRALDNSPDSISMQMTRHDVIDGDQVGIAFDTYYDKRTAFIFAVSAVGVKAYWVMSNDGENEDFSWDPIWWVKTAKTDDGWNAELRIPLTQLHFKNEGEQLWGLQVFRQIFRKEELSFWQPMERGGSGIVSQFGSMNGLKNIQSKKTLDIMPYVVARTDRFEKEPENPFRQSGKKNSLDAGLDAKIGLTRLGR